MTFRSTPLERAFTLARSGDYVGVAEIKSQLKAEGYGVQQLEGPLLMRQLRELCIASKKPGDAETPDAETPDAETTDVEKPDA